LKKTVLEKVPSHATVDEVEGMVKKHLAYGAVNVFYDVDSHSIVSLKEEEIVQNATLDDKDAENLLDQNTNTVLVALKDLSSKKDFELLLKTEKAGKNRKKVISAIEERL